jgi:hypothetical protein
MLEAQKGGKETGSLTGQKAPHEATHEAFSTRISVQDALPNVKGRSN